MSSGMDIHVIAERVAEVVNKKIAAIDRRISELESRLKKLELDVGTLRTKTIESIVRSVLTIKIEDLAAAVAVKVSSGFSESLRDVVRVSEELRGAVADIRNAVEGLGELKALPEKVVEALRSVKPSVQVDMSRIEAMVSGVLSRSMKNIEELSARVGTLEEKVSELSANLGRLGESLTALTTAISRFEDMKRTIDEMKESVVYSRKVLSILEERLRGRPSEEEEE